MISHSTLQSSSLIDNPINSKNRYLAISSIGTKSDNHRRKPSQRIHNKYERNLTHRDYGDIVNDYSVSEKIKNKINKTMDTK